ncbi:MAG: hypothetical protein WAK48_02535 [Candidatus Acidiferrum sp.]|jgi:hypothetical protein
MSRLTATFIALALAGAISSPAQSTQSKEAQASAAAERTENLPKGTRLMGKLTTKLDTKYTQAGQPVVIEVAKDVKSGDQIFLKKGSLIKGTVTQVQAFSKGKSDAAFEISLDRVVPKGGEQFPDHFAIYALSAKLEEQPGDMYTSKKGLATSAGISGQAGAPKNTDITPETTGIYGFDGVQLHPLVRMTPPSASVNSSTGNIVLEKETTFVLESLGQ